MTDPIVECVPNFSEGRDSSVIQALSEAVQAVPQVVLLDRTSDPDHHRSVLTLAGPPEAVAEAAFQACRIATERIDLRRHQGVHPRVGATDVMPFVPVRGMTMADCMDLASRVACRIGEELGIPVFLYEQSARQPVRRRLEAIRRGGVEALAKRMAEDPAWHPDYGPARLHPTAGATVVGARPFLVAFNVNVASEDLAVAKAIARRVRESSGGLPGVKAIGVPLPSRRLVQVSMNLTDLGRTPIHHAYAAVVREAAHAGVRLAGSELIGLVPLQGILATAQQALGLEVLSERHILEIELEQALRRGQTQPADTSKRDERPEAAFGNVADLLHTLGEAGNLTAGALAAGLAGALSAQLGAKVLAIQEKRKSTPSGSASRLADLGTRLWDVAQRDAPAYAKVLESARRLKQDPEEAPVFSEALEQATEIPLAMAGLVAEVRRLLPEVESSRDTALSPDVFVARELARAAFLGLRSVVLENCKRQSNHRVKDKMLHELKQMERCLEGPGGLW
ncbi:Formimidoyltetrahydrofolate cyclodeaminase [Nitrospira tepida]|uniref:Formimidoyltransferase-cyclodeaminase n=1 Tax=Nitrospira tepida TaxID=2973512 RepID=A0AA86N2N8_9BACT|nr:glutamate formimidoyltransferase [Nitrospira tepida]CAI4033713.1 Formimidoyltetrahydrofolate cyclodeaminase [Nitrospira tepida]